MNKTLFDAVKARAKDTGLSEKYLQKITEKIGGGIADDSTDDKAIEDMANQIAEIAVETQGEATRWANKNKNPKPNDPKKNEEGTGKNEEGTGKQDATIEKLEALEKQIAALVAGNAKQEREKAISSAQKKHGIPEWRMKGLVVPEDVEPDVYLAEIKQDLITQNLMPATSEGEKATNEQAVEKAADSLLDLITVK